VHSRSGVFDRTVLHFAVLNGPFSLIELLLSKNVDIEASDSTGSTPLYLATRNGNVHAVKQLLQAGADVNATNEDGNTALHIATELDNIFIVQVLLDKGACVNANNDIGSTPLHYATSKNAIELLLQAGADVKAKNKEGVTALHQAATNDYCHISIVEMLLAKGARVDAKDNNGRTPLHYGSDHGRKAIAERLLATGADANAKDKDGKTPADLARQSKTGPHDKLAARLAEAAERQESSRSLDTLTIDEVAQWLENKGLDCYVGDFKSNSISGADLLLLNEQDLEEIGVTRRWHRVRILNSVAESDVDVTQSPTMQQGGKRLRLQ